jgi:hypothetical protein
MVEIIKQAELAYLSMSKLSELSQSARLVNQARPKSLLGSLNQLSPNWEEHAKAAGGELPLSLPLPALSIVLIDSDP